MRFLPAIRPPALVPATATEIVFQVPAIVVGVSLRAVAGEPFGHPHPGGFSASLPFPRELAAHSCWQILAATGTATIAAAIAASHAGLTDVPPGCHIWGRHQPAPVPTAASEGTPRPPSDLTQVYRLRLAGCRYTDTRLTPRASRSASGSRRPACAPARWRAGLGLWRSAVRRRSISADSLVHAAQPSPQSNQAMRSLCLPPTMECMLHKSTTLTPRRQWIKLAIARVDCPEPGCQMPRGTPCRRLDGGEENLTRNSNAHLARRRLAGMPANVPTH